MPTWSDVIIAAVLLTFGLPTAIRGLAAWWRFERELARRARGMKQQAGEERVW